RRVRPLEAQRAEGQRPDRDPRSARNCRRLARARRAALCRMRPGIGQRVNYDPSSLEGVPEAGRERLRRMRETDGGFFTSDLSVNEFMLIKQAGFQPLGLVVGSSVYHIGLQL